MCWDYELDEQLRVKLPGGRTEKTMGLMQEHFCILILNFSFSFFVQCAGTSVPRQIQQTLLTSNNCVNDLRKHDECHLSAHS